MERIPPKQDRTFYAPIVVFYLNREKVLMPLCIQLTRGKDFHNEIYSPGNYFSVSGIFFKLVF